MFNDTVEGVTTPAPLPFRPDDDEGIGAPLARFLAARPTPPRVLALGEPTHGVGSFPRMRNAALRYLVEHAGFRSVALESDAPAGLAVDAWVRGGPGDLDDLLATGFSHGFGAYAANRELLVWLREHNRDRADPVRFHGFDAPLEMTHAQSPRTALLALHAHLSAVIEPPCTAAGIEELTGPDARWTEPAAATDPSRSVGSTPEVTALRLLADDLRTLLHAHAPALLAATSPDAWWTARLHARTAAGLLRYHATMADPGPARFARMMQMRDAMMAENLLAVVERDGPTLAFAHNGHLQYDQGSWAGLRWWSAGAIAAAELGAGYAVLVSALGRGPGVGDPPPGTPEAVLAALPAGRLIADPAVLHGTAKRTDIPPRRGCFPLDPAHPEGSDGIVFVRDAY